MRKGANNTLDILAPKRDKEMANKLIKPCLMKLRKGDMSNDFCNNKQVHSAIIPSLYYEQHREWDDYVYKGIYGLKEISLRYDVPFSLLIARLKKGLSLHEAVTYKKKEETSPDIGFITKIESSIMKTPSSISGRNPNNKEIDTYTVKIYKQGQSLPFPDKMSPLWRLALGLCPTR